MLCEECHNNEANFTVSIVSGEELTTRHLCADCMSRMNADLMKGNLRSFLTTKSLPCCTATTFCASSCCS